MLDKVSHNCFQDLSDDEKEYAYVLFAKRCNHR